MENKKEENNSQGVIIAIIIVVIMIFFALKFNKTEVSTSPNLVTQQPVATTVLTLNQINQDDKERLNEIFTGIMENTISTNQDIENESRGIFEKYNATPEEIQNYIKKFEEDFRQNNSKTSNVNIPKEKTMADVIAEWSARVVLVVCMWTDPNSGKLIQAGRGSGVLNYFKDGGFHIITNRHVLVYKESGPSSCNVLFPWDKNFDVYNINDNFKMGTEEDYGFIKLPSDLFLSKFPTDNLKRCPLDSVVLGDKLVILGFPAIGSDAGITATEGIVSGIEQNYFVTSAKIDEGNSGGAAILMKNDCYLGIPSASIIGGIESLGRILKWNFVIN